MQNLKAAAIRSRAKKRAKVHVGSVFQGPSSQSTLEAAQPATVQSSLEGISQAQCLPSAHVISVTAPPAVLPGHLVLYKAKAAVEMEDWLDDDGSIELSGMKTFPGGDFNHRSVAHYWTSERKTAQQYLGFARERCSYSELWFLQIQLSPAFVETIKLQDIWYSPNWKELVWYRRKSRPPPEKFPHFWDYNHTDIVRGHVCKAD